MFQFSGQKAKEIPQSPKKTESRQSSNSRVYLEFTFLDGDGVDLRVPGCAIDHGFPECRQKIEYTRQHGEMVSIQALWNGERRLCMNAYLDFDGRKFIHMPDYRTPENRRQSRYAIYYDDPKCRETEKFKEPSY